MDVVCFGELLVDMFPAEVGQRLAEVTAFLPKPGGAPANVAVGLSRLGTRSAFIGKVGDDAFGHHLAAVLAGEGVETRGIRFDKQARTTLAFIAKPDFNSAEFLFYRNPGADTRMEASELDRELLTQTKVFHFGSLSLAEEPIHDATLSAIQLVREAGGFVSFDVNYRPTLWANPKAAFGRVMDVIPYADLLKVNEVELELMTGEEDPEKGSAKLLELGPSICVMTSGAGGSCFRVAGGFGFIPAFEVDTLDAIGCGDAFIAGLLTRLISRSEWQNRLTPEVMHRHLTYANAVGALTATKQGVIPALPTAEAVEAFLSRQPMWRELNATP